MMKNPNLGAMEMREMVGTWEERDRDRERIQKCALFRVVFEVESSDQRMDDSTLK